MARIVVHIGAHKTATTYLQRRFALNRERLKALGVIYPSCHGVDQHSCLAGIWINVRLDQAHFVEGGAEAHFDAFVAEHAREDGLVFLSSEAFSRFNPTRVDMAELAARLAPFDDVHVVFTVRDQPTFLQSIWMQRNRKSPNRDTLDTYVDRTIKTGLANGIHADFNALYDRVVAGFGADRVSVLNYDALCAHPGGPFGAYLAFLGVTEPAERFEDLPGPQLANISPAPLAFELARQATAPESPSPGLVRLADRALALRRATSLLTRGQHARLVDRFAPLNAALVEKVRLRQPEFGFEIPDLDPDLFHIEDITEAQRARFTRLLARRTALNRAASRVLPSILDGWVGRRFLSLNRTRD